MRRILTSSRLWVGVGSIAAAVLISFFGVDEQQADAAAARLIDMIKWIGLFWMGGTAIEDAARKLTDLPPTPGGNGRLNCHLLPLLLALALAPGCSLVNPGGDTRTASESRSVTTWDGQDNLSLTEDSTHNRRVAAIEGENVTVEYYPDGTPKSVSGATHMLTQCSEPRDVMQGYMHLANRNAEVAGGLIDLANSLLPAVLARNNAGRPQMSNQLQGLLQRMDPLIVEDALLEYGVDRRVIEYLVSQLPRATQPAP